MVRSARAPPLTSLMSNEQALSSNLWPHPFEWGNFAEVFHKAPMWRYTLNTMIYAGLSARPAPVGSGVLALDLKGSLVEQPSRRQWSEVAGGSRLQEYRLRDLVISGAVARRAERRSSAGR